MEFKLSMSVKNKYEEHSLPSVSIVMGYLAIKDCSSLNEKINILSMLGYGKSEMAQICGTTLNNISSVINKSKSKKSAVKSVKLKKAK